MGMAGPQAVPLILSESRSRDAMRWPLRHCAKQIKRPPLLDVVAEAPKKKKQNVVYKVMIVCGVEPRGHDLG
jgi:hypothetical protein